MIPTEYTYFLFFCTRNNPPDIFSYAWQRKNNPQIISSYIYAQKKYPVYTEHLVKTDTAAGRGRTGTGITTHGILSPGRLPIPPLRHIQFALKATRMGLEPMTSAVTGRRSNQLSHRAL